MRFGALWKTLLLLAAVAAIRITAPSDLYNGDQPKQVAYIRDIARNGAWLVQHDEGGTVASKPPLYSWLAAPPILFFGESEFLLKLPSLLAAIATLLLVWDLSRRTMGAAPAGLAISFLVLSQLFSKHLYYARTDMLLTACVVAQIWAAARFECHPEERSDEGSSAIPRRPSSAGMPGILRFGQDDKRKWVWFFRLAGAAGMLAKGPIALVIPLSALAAWWWKRGVLRQRVREMEVVIGIVWSAIPLAIWFSAALIAEGPPFYQQLIVAETIDRFDPSSTKSKEHRHVLYYLPHLMARMAPWSFLALFVLIFRRARETQLPIYWVLAPLIVLSLIPSKRADRLLPLLPAICMLAGYAFDSWLSRSEARRLNLATGIAVWIVLAALIGAGAFVARVSIPFGITLSLAALAAGFALALGRTNLFVLALYASLLTAIGAYQHLFMV